MDISVIVVTYNQESSIGRTLDSILAQETDAEFEIIIGDDCSTDGTEAVCRRYAEKYPDKIKYIRRSENLGVTRNYFDCIERAQGRYLADCAGDDFWIDNSKLQKQFEILEKRPDVTVVATRWNIFRANDNSKTPSPEAYPPGEYEGSSLLVPIITDGAPIHLCTCLYRKKIINDALDTKREFMIDAAYSCEDQQILLALADAGKIVVLPDITLNYSVGHDSISHRHEFRNRFAYSLKAFRQSLKLQQSFLDDIDGEKIEKVRKYNEKLTNYLATLMFRSGPEICDEYGKSSWIMTDNIPVKSKIYKALMANKNIWKLALSLRNIMPV